MAISRKEKIILGSAALVFIVGMSLVVFFVLSFAENDFNGLAHLNQK